MKPDHRVEPPVKPAIAHLGDEKHLTDYVRVLYKRRWVALPVFLIVFVAMAVNSLRETPIYQAKVQLLIEKDAPNVARLDQMFQSQDSWYTDEFYQTQHRILQSRSLAKQTLQAMKLWNAPRPAAANQGARAFSLTNTVRAGIGAAVALVKEQLGVEETSEPQIVQRIDET